MWKLPDVVHPQDLLDGLDVAVRLPQPLALELVGPEELPRPQYVTSLFLAGVCLEQESVDHRLASAIHQVLDYLVLPHVVFEVGEPSARVSVGQRFRVDGSLEPPHLHRSDSHDRDQVDRAVRLAPGKVATTAVPLEFVFS